MGCIVKQNGQSRLDDRPSERFQTAYRLLVSEISGNAVRLCVHPDTSGGCRGG